MKNETLKTKTEIEYETYRQRLRLQCLVSYRDRDYGFSATFLTR